MKYETDDTIAAISTPPGEGGIGIVRLSGKSAARIAAKIFHAKDGRGLCERKTFSVHYGHIKKDGEVIDEALLTIMRAPKTYTREDVLEISCHGGIVPLRKVLSLCLEEGARLARPGEFTERAFLNGRIDLAQAEAVCDVIRAKTDAALKCALSQLQGRLSGEVNKIRQEIVDILACIEAALDYPDEDIEFLGDSELVRRMDKTGSALEALIKTAQAGRILKEGLRTIIVGKPNAGKSSLLNALLREERAIVTPVPGTTRDIIEDTLDIFGIPVNIMDTAGIRHTTDEIEVLGVERARSSLKQADLILFVVDSSVHLSEEDRLIVDDVKNQKVIVVSNKSDLKQVTKEKDIKNLFSENPPPPVVKVSATGGSGIREVEKLIYRQFMKGEIDISDAVLVTDIRHRDALVKAEEAIKRAKNAAGRKESGEFIALDLRQCLDSLGEIVGETTSEDILDRIFSRFCVGK